MLKALTAAVVVAVLAGEAAAGDGITVQDQIYVVSGVLGGVCLLLTLAAIFTTLAITKLQTQVAVLQAGSPRPAPVDNSNPLSGGGGGGLGRDISQPSQLQKPPPQSGLPRTDVLPRVERVPRSEGVTRYNSSPQEDPYRAPPRERENFRMQGPVPPPRPYRGPPAPRENYY